MASQQLIEQSDLETHKLAVARHSGVYNFVRKHARLETTTAGAAGLEQTRWSLERVVEMTEAYWQPKHEAAMAAKAAAQRAAEDAEFEQALAGLRLVSSHQAAEEED